MANSLWGLLSVFSATFFSPFVQADSAPILSHQLPQDVQYIEYIASQIRQASFSSDPLHHIEVTEALQERSGSPELTAFIYNAAGCTTPGDEQTYRIVIRNVGFDTARDTSVQFQYPPSNEFVKGSMNPRHEEEQRIVAWDAQDLVPGGYLSFTATLATKQLAPHHLTNLTVYYSDEANNSHITLSEKSLSGVCGITDSLNGFIAGRTAAQPAIVCDPAEVNCQQTFRGLRLGPRFSGAIEPTVCSVHNKELRQGVPGGGCQDKRPQLGLRFAEAISDIVPGDCRVLDDNRIEGADLQDGLGRRSSVSLLHLRPLHGSSNAFRTLVQENRLLSLEHAVVVDSQLRTAHTQNWEELVAIIVGVIENRLTPESARDRLNDSRERWEERITEAQERLQKEYERVIGKRKENFPLYVCGQLSVNVVPDTCQVTKNAEASIKSACGVEDQSGGAGQNIVGVQGRYNGVLDQRNVEYNTTQDEAKAEYVRTLVRWITVLPDAFERYADEEAEEEDRQPLLEYYDLALGLKDAIPGRDLYPSYETHAHDDEVADTIIRIGSERERAIIASRGSRSTNTIGREGNALSLEGAIDRAKQLAIQCAREEPRPQEDRNPFDNEPPQGGFDDPRTFPSVEFVADERGPALRFCENRGPGGPFIIPPVDGSPVRRTDAIPPPAIPQVAVTIDTRLTFGSACSGRPGDPWWAPGCECDCGSILPVEEGSVQFCKPGEGHYTNNPRQFVPGRAPNYPRPELLGSNAHEAKSTTDGSALAAMQSVAPQHVDVGSIGVVRDVVKPLVDGVQATSAQDAYSSVLQSVVPALVRASSSPPIEKTPSKWPFLSRLSDLTLQVPTVQAMEHDLPTNSAGMSIDSLDGERVLLATALNGDIPVGNTTLSSSFFSWLSELFNNSAEPELPFEDTTPPSDGSPDVFYIPGAYDLSTGCHPYAAYVEFHDDGTIVISDGDEPLPEPSPESSPNPSTEPPPPLPASECLTLCDSCKPGCRSIEDVACWGDDPVQCDPNNEGEHRSDGICDCGCPWGEDPDCSAAATPTPSNLPPDPSPEPSEVSPPPSEEPLPSMGPPTPSEEPPSENPPQIFFFPGPFDTELGCDPTGGTYIAIPSEFFDNNNQATGETPPQSSPVDEQDNSASEQPADVEEDDLSSTEELVADDQNLWETIVAALVDLRDRGINVFNQTLNAIPAIPAECDEVCNPACANYDPCATVCGSDCNPACAERDPTLPLPECNPGCDAADAQPIVCNPACDDGDGYDPCNNLCGPEGNRGECNPECDTFNPCDGRCNGFGQCSDACFQDNKDRGNFAIPPECNPECPAFSDEGPAVCNPACKDFGLYDPCDNLCGPDGNKGECNPACDRYNPCGTSCNGAGPCTQECFQDNNDRGNFAIPPECQPECPAFGDSGGICNPACAEFGLYEPCNPICGGEGSRGECNPECFKQRQSDNDPSNDITNPACNPGCLQPGDEPIICKQECGDVYDPCSASCEDFGGGRCSQECFTGGNGPRPECSPACPQGSNPDDPPVCNWQCTDAYNPCSPACGGQCNQGCFDDRNNDDDPFNDLEVPPECNPGCQLFEDSEVPAQCNPTCRGLDIYAPCDRSCEEYGLGQCSRDCWFYNKDPDFPHPDCNPECPFGRTPECSVNCQDVYEPCSDSCGAECNQECFEDPFNFDPDKKPPECNPGCLESLEFPIGCNPACEGYGYDPCNNDCGFRPDDCEEEEDEEDEENPPIPEVRYECANPCEICVSNPNHDPECRTDFQVACWYDDPLDCDEQHQGTEDDDICDCGCAWGWDPDCGPIPTLEPTTSPSDIPTLPPDPTGTRLPTVPPPPSDEPTPPPPPGPTSRPPSPDGTTPPGTRLPTVPPPPSDEPTPPPPPGPTSRPPSPDGTTPPTPDPTGTRLPTVPPPPSDEPTPPPPPGPTSRPPSPDGTTPPTPDPTGTRLPTVPPPPSDEPTPPPPPGPTSRPPSPDGTTPPTPDPTGTRLPTVPPPPSDEPTPPPPPDPTVLPSPDSTPSVSPNPSPSATTSPTLLPETPAPSPTPSVSPSPCPTISPSATPSVSPTASMSPSPLPIIWHDIWVTSRDECLANFQSDHHFNPDTSEPGLQTKPIPPGDAGGGPAEPCPTE